LQEKIGACQAIVWLLADKFFGIDYNVFYTERYKVMVTPKPTETCLIGGFKSAAWILYL
jgi:hypothetical protein